MKDNDLCFTRIIKDFVWRYPYGTVVNIGFPIEGVFGEVKKEKVRWYELDLPCEFSQKGRKDDGRICISSTILRDDWYLEIGCNENILFVAEGIFCCYTEKKVKSLLSHLCMHFASFELLFNVISPFGMTTWNYVIQRPGSDEPFIRWGLYRAGRIIGWNPRFRLLGDYSVSTKGMPFSHPRDSIKYLLWKLFCRWRVLHIRVRYNYRNLNA